MDEIKEKFKLAVSIKYSHLRNLHNRAYIYYNYHYYMLSFSLEESTSALANKVASKKTTAANRATYAVSFMNEEWQLPK